MSKRRGKHITSALNALQVVRLSAPGRYADGNGLYLEIDKVTDKSGNIVGGAKRWTLRVTRRVADADGYVSKGTRHDLGLGRVSDVSLADARIRAAELRQAASEGKNVLAMLRAVRIEAAATDAPTPLLPTFEKIAREVHTAYKPTWKNQKAATQWLTSLETYAFPIFGAKPVKDVEQSDVLKCLSPIWTTKIETASRLKQRLGVVFDWAKTHGHRTGDNPCSGIEHGLPNQPKTDKHHGALTIDAMPDFMSKLRTHDAADTVTRLSLEWLILTATRQGETRGAAWPEIDAKAKTWTIPAERMKADNEHVVPLTERCIEILAEMRALAPDAKFIFPATSGKMLSENTHANLVKAVSGDDNATAHGMRSTFRDWASERTSFPSDVAEMALAHTIRNKVEAAYRRGNLLEKRRELMAAWNQFVLPDTASNVTTLADARRLKLV